MASIRRPIILTSRALQKIIGNARFVGLGESVHGSGGFLKAKLHLIQFMVEKLGYRQIGFETNWGDAQIAGAYVDSCQGTAAGAMSKLEDIWNDPSIQNLLTWLCQYNSAHPDKKVQFFGIDVQEPWYDGTSLTAFFTKTSPGTVNALMSPLSTCLGITHSPRMIFTNRRRGSNT